MARKPPKIKPATRIMFLLGAGASAEAGVHTSDAATEVLINYASYCPSKYSTEIENLLKYIQVRIGDHLNVRASSVNFEFLLGTLVELSKKGEYPLVPLLGEGDLLVKRLEGKLPLAKVIEKLYALLRELLVIRKPLSYLHPIKDFLALSKPLDLFTLNYDLTLESVLADLQLSFTTGYRKRKDNLSLWTPAEFEKQSFDARIFKLHGSINWGRFFYYSPPSAWAMPTSNELASAGLYITTYPESVEFEPSPIRRVEPPGRTLGMVSLMNFGTRKELLYASSQFNILFNNFSKALQDADVCVVAGYSFRDDTINKLLEEVIISKKGLPHLVIVSPSLHWLVGSNPLLEEFRRFQWITGIDKGFGESLRDGSLLSGTKEKLKRPHERKKDVVQTPHIRADESGEQNPDSTRIIEKWQDLGTTFDLTYFWMKRLSGEMRECGELSNEQDMLTVGQLLLPLLKNVRNLCFGISEVYEEMHFNVTYGGDYLETIKINPAPVKDFPHADAAHRWLPELGPVVSLVFNTYHHTTEEFIRAVKDPSFGKRVGAPSNLSAAEVVIRKVPSRIYELVWILNDIYKGVGYEEPFAQIAQHQSKL